MRATKGLLQYALIITILSILFTCEKSPQGPDTWQKPKGTISGWITDKKGNPKKGVLVSIDADSAVPAISDSTGFFRIGEVKKGVYILKFTHRDYKADSTYIVSLGQGQDDTIHNPIRLSYTYYIISGKVVYNNSTVPGAGVALSGYPISTLTDGTGMFTLDGIPRNAKVKLICAKSGIGYCSDSSITGIPDDTTRIHDIRLIGGGATVYGTVYDTSGSPITTIAVVAAVGGGLVDTTDGYGNYVLENVPTNELVNIYVPGNDKFYGSTIGFMLQEGSLTKIDIYLRPVTVLTIGNGMALYVNDIIVNESERTAKLPVFPTTDENTVIKSFQWRVAGTLSFRDYQTTEPVLYIAIDTLKVLTWLKSVSVSVEAINTRGGHSQPQTFKVTIATNNPLAVAKVSSESTGPFTDTVRIRINEMAFFKGEAQDPFGGIDSVSWNFGDGSPVVTDMVALAHTYQKLGVFYAKFRVVDNDKNTATDSVRVTVVEPALGRPKNVTPADGDTIFNTDTVTLAWRPVAGTGITYDVYLDSLNFPAGVLKIASSADTSARLHVDSGIIYAWKIVAKRGAEKGVGDCWRFCAGGTLANRPPKFTVDSTGMTDTATVGKLYKDTAIARDPDGDSLSFSFKDSVAGMSLTAKDSMCFISWTPQKSAVGKNRVTIQAKDDKGGTAVLSWNIGVGDTTNINPQGLVAYYPFNGNAKDESGNGNNGMIYGAVPTIDRFGSAGSAYSFDGLDSILCPKLSIGNVTGLSFSAWIKTNEINRMSVLQTGPQIIYLSRFSNNGHLTASFDGDSWDAGQSNEAVNTGEWVHIVCTNNDSLTRLYIDGSADIFYAETLSTLALNSLIIGSQRDVPENGFKGLIDDIRIYKRALSDAEIDSLYHLGGWPGNPPIVTVDPQSKTVNVGQTATFGVTATGTKPFTYKWQKNGTDISGATDSSYTTPATTISDSGAAFRCIVSNGAGADTSAVAILTVTTVTIKPTITADPQNQTVTVGQTATFCVTATGTKPFTYQWQKNDTAISGATDSSYTTTSTVMSDNGSKYRCIVGNSAGKDTSANAVLTVNPVSGLIAYYPFNGNANDESGNGNNGMVYGATLTSDRFGITGKAYSFNGTNQYIEIAINPPNLYTFGTNSFSISAWVNTSELDQDRSFFSKASSTTNESWSFLFDLLKGLRFYQYVKQAYGPQIYQGNTTGWQTNTWYHVVFVRDGNQIKLYKDTINVAIGNSSTPLDSIPAGIVRIGREFNRYWSGAIDELRVYNRALTSVQIDSLYHLGGWLGNPPVITVDPQPVTVNEGQTATFRVTATGTRPFTYQWKKNSIDISGATDSTYTIPFVARSDSGNYSVVMSNAAGSATSNAAHLAVITAPVITKQPVSDTVNIGQPASFSVTAIGNPAPVYQWKKNGTPISGATANTYSIASASVSDTGNYTVDVMNPVDTVTSNQAHLTVMSLSLPIITKQPVSQTVNAGQAVSFSVTATGNPTPTYQWSNNGTPISGATANTYSIASTSISDTGYYTVVVSNIQGRVTSNPARLTVVNVMPPTITGQPQPKTVNVGQTATFGVIATGTKPFTYKWQIFDLTAVWTAISGAIDSSYTTPAATQSDSGSLFRCIVTNGAGADTSAAALLAVDSVTIYPPVITADPVNQIANVGDTAVFHVSVQGGGITFLWQCDSSGILNDLPSSNDSIYKKFSATISDSGKKFRCIVSNSGGNDTSMFATLTVIADTVTDIDGNVYHTVTIGSQTWLVENLKTTRYKDGTAIPFVADSAAWGSLTTPGRCWYNNDSSTYMNTYGALYNWYTVNTGKLAPTGWHVPTDQEWDTLINYLGGSSVAGGKLKEIGLAHWNSPNTNATNETGFSALPGGCRDDGYYDISRFGYWWSTTEYDASNSWFFIMGYQGAYVSRTKYLKMNGFSVRCVKD